MFRIDLLALTSLAAYALLVVITLASAPRQDVTGAGRRRALGLVVLGTALAYLAASPWLFLLGWVITILPLWLEPGSYSPGVRIVHMVSTGALVLGFLPGMQPALAFGLLTLAVLLRKGLFPAHFWVPSAFENGSLSLLGLLLNGHLGAYLLIRFALPMFPEAATRALSIIGILAILTSVYGALLALNAERPRRILALLCTSQAAFILAGLENRNVEGITGALLHWWVVAFATTGLLSAYRAIEARTTEAESPQRFLGLGFHAPRLAVFFAVSALALVGLPGTLGFAAEDLLFHGALESHPLLGIGLPVATALNAITALRLLATLFMGRRGLHVPRIADALPRERWALTLPVLLLVAGGMAPAVLVSLRAPAAEWIAGLLSR